MVCLSRFDIEQIAQRVLRAYIAKCTPHELPVCIEPEKLVTDLLGLYMEDHVLSTDGHILGLTAFSSVGVSIFDTDESASFYELDGKTILIDSRLYDDQTKAGRLNFTVMHEASHQILHMLYPEEYGVYNRNAVPIYYSVNTDKMIRPPIRNWGEWQANVLASALLLPEFVIRNGMQQLGMGDRMEILNPLYRKKDFAKFVELANYLGASRKALAIRMKLLGLLKEDYLDRPKSMLDIFCEGEI